MPPSVQGSNSFPILTLPAVTVEQGFMSVTFSKLPDLSVCETFFIIQHTNPNQNTVSFSDSVHGRSTKKGTLSCHCLEEGEGPEQTPVSGLAPGIILLRRLDKLPNRVAAKLW